MHDMYHSKYTNLEKDYSLEELATFHGHLGPFLVLGYRIGRYAKNYICSDPFHLSVEVHCSGNTPQSCIVDGLQLGSGCTYGKRNIDIIAGPEIKCLFAVNGGRIEVRPKPIIDVGDDDAKIEELAEKMYKMDDPELFDVIAVKN
jgi:formylmethanofuran dehydrogenase subunit E